MLRWREGQECISIYSP